MTRSKPRSKPTSPKSARRYDGIDLPDWDEVVEAFMQAGRYFGYLSNIFRFVGGAHSAPEPGSLAKATAPASSEKALGRCGCDLCERARATDRLAVASVPPEGAKRGRGDGRARKIRFNPCVLTNSFVVDQDAVRKMVERGEKPRKRKGSSKFVWHYGDGTKSKPLTPHGFNFITDGG